MAPINFLALSLLKKFLPHVFFSELAVAAEVRGAVTPGAAPRLVNLKSGAMLDI
jgi:hypothetical protein